MEHVFQCPNEKCERLFIARYARTSDLRNTHFEWRSSVPTEPLDVPCSDIILKMSPDYCAIYSQAHKAEQHGLELIAGPGYRKALEFLIKDYLCLLHPKDKAQIEKMLLGNCIETFIASGQIRATAKRAAWLGNDETHFVRKWEGKDLKDLKVLIGLTVRWIEMEEMTKEVVADMPEGEK